MVTAKKFGVGGNIGYNYGGKGQINKQQTRGGSIFGSQKEIPDVSLLRHVGKKEGGSVKADKIQEERHARTLRQLAKEEQAEADKMARGGAVMKKPNPFAGKESAKEEKAEKKLPPWMYKKGEKAEGEMACGGKVKKMAKGGMARGKRFDDGGDVTADSKEVLLPEAEAAGLRAGPRAGPRAANTFVQKGEYTPPKVAATTRARPNAASQADARKAEPAPTKAVSKPSLLDRMKTFARSPEASANYAKGGYVRAADGIAQRGKTKGRVI